MMTPVSEPTVKFPWLAGGRPVDVPSLTIDDVRDLKHREVAILKQLGLRDTTEQWERARLEDLADVWYLQEATYHRLRKADPLLAREAFNEEVRDETALLFVAGQVMMADDAKRPRDEGTGFRTPPGRGPQSRADGGGTGDSTSRKPRTWRRAFAALRRPWGSRS